jgi:hypothetical protein
MTSKKQKHSYNSPGEGATSSNDSAKQSAHSAPATPKPPSGSNAPRSGKVSDSAPALGDAKFASKATKVSNAKVAIPRQPPGNTQRYNRRVPRACESCRQRKTKCSGDTPVCRQCRELRVTCHYPVGWREKMKRWVFFLTVFFILGY